MPKPVLAVIAVLLLLGLAGGGILGWMWMTRDRVAVATYRLKLEEGASMSQIIEQERELMQSEKVLKQVIEKLDLVKRWKFDSEEEAITHMQTKLKVRDDPGTDRVRVIYRDRNQDRALEVLEEVNKVFAKVRFEEARKNSMPPVIPLENKESASQ